MEGKRTGTFKILDCPSNHIDRKEWKTVFTSNVIAGTTITPKPADKLNDDNIENASGNTLATKTRITRQEFHMPSTLHSMRKHMMWPLSSADLRIAYEYL